MKENLVEIRHYNRKGETINVSLDEFREHIQRIMEATIKKILELS